MQHPLRFFVINLPNAPWDELLERVRLIEDLGFDVLTSGDHFVDWSNPPRYAIPLWIEGEKFFFWALVYALALLYPFLRRTGLAFRTVLYGFLNLYVWGVLLFARPFTEPLAKLLIATSSTN